MAIIWGTSGNDTRFGTGARDFFYLLSGHDRAYGGGGSDDIYGGYGSDWLYGGPLNDYLVGGPGWDRLYGGSDADYLYGEAGHDSLFGGHGHDRLNGGDGNDRFFGGDGHDTAYGGAGNDLFYHQDYEVGGDVHGGPGSDGLVLENVAHTWGFTIDLANNTYGITDNPSAWMNQTITNVERIYASQGGDTVLGRNDTDETFFGYGGNDALHGRGGNDGLYGGAGADVIRGGMGRDSIGGGTGADTLIVRGAWEVEDGEFYGGGLGEDTLQIISWGSQTYDFTASSLSSIDVLDLDQMGDFASTFHTRVLLNVDKFSVGMLKTFDIDMSAARDSVSFQISAKTTLDLSTVDVFYAGTQDRIVLLGDASNERFIGTGVTDVIRGGAGVDRLEGRGGDDILIGGQGADILIGGAGQDRFDFNTAAESGFGGAARDTVQGFVKGQDRIDLDTLDARPDLAGNQDFTLITGGFSGTGGEVRLVETAGGNTRVLIDLDGSAAGAEMEVFVAGVIGLGLGDFLL